MADKLDLGITWDDDVATQYRAFEDRNQTALDREWASYTLLQQNAGEKKEEAKPGDKLAQRSDTQRESESIKAGGEPQKPAAFGNVVGPVARGVGDAARETYSFVRNMVPFANRLPEVTKGLDDWNAARQGYPMPSEYNTGQHLLKGAAQFAGPFAAFKKGVQFVKDPLGMTKVFSQALGGAAKAEEVGVLGNLVAAGAAQMVASDPNEHRVLSDVVIPKGAAGMDKALGQLFGGEPGMAKALASYLQADPTDTNAEKYFKSFIEGALMDLGFKGAGVLLKHAVRGITSLAKAMKAHVHEGLEPGMPTKIDVTPEGIHVQTPMDAGSQAPKYGNPEIKRLRTEYQEHAGLPAEDPASLLTVDQKLAKEVADSYAAMKHAPNDPEVQLAYRSFADETWEMFTWLEREGYKFEPWTKEGMPYPNSTALREDVLQNKHLYFFTGGDLPGDHPLMKTMPNGWTANDVFRAVHDIFGHAADGHEFGMLGETKAWMSHGSMYSTRALPAMTNETLGQGQWAHFGGHLQDEAGQMAKAGQKAGAKPEAKAGTMDTKAASQQAAAHAPNMSARLSQQEVLGLKAVAGKLGFTLEADATQAPNLKEFMAAGESAEAMRIVKDANKKEASKPKWKALPEAAVDNTDYEREIKALGLTYHKATDEPSIGRLHWYTDPVTESTGIVRTPEDLKGLKAHMEEQRKMFKGAK